MVNVEEEAAAMQVWTEVLYYQNYSEQLAPSNAVVFFGSTQCMAEISHNTFSISNLLGQDSPNAYIAGICVHNEGLLGVRVGQN